MKSKQKLNNELYWQPKLYEILALRLHLLVGVSDTLGWVFAKALDGWYTPLSPVCRDKAPTLT